MDKLKFVLIFFLLLIVVPRSYSQCAVDAPSKDYNIISKKTVSFDDKVNDFFLRVKKLYGLSCHYYYYDDSKSPNAEANRDDGNIYLGVNIMQDAYNTSNGYIGIYFVIAHEMSHLLQYDEDKSLLDFGTTVRYGELQADFMAGYILSRYRYIDDSNYNKLLSQIWDMGDFGWNSPNTHGTSSERVADAAIGMSNSSQPVETAYTASFNITPPDPKRRNKYVARIDFNNGNSLLIKYGGAVYDKNGQHVGQFTSVPNTYNYRVNFSKEGEYDVIISGNYVYTLNNQYIGTYTNF